LRVGALLRSERQIYREGAAWTVKWKAWLKDTAQLSEEARWVIDQHLEHLATLEQQLRKVERRVAEVTAEDTLVARLMDQPGIGPITAWMVRAHIGQFDRFRSGKQLSRFCGLTPRNASSGERQADAGLIRAGNPALRATLIEASQRLIRLDGRWRDYSMELRVRGKPYSVAVAAVANRWVRWLFHQMQAVPAA
jgi:transposase